MDSECQCRWCGFVRGAALVSRPQPSQTLPPPMASEEYRVVQTWGKEPVSFDRKSHYRCPDLDAAEEMLGRIQSIYPADRTYIERRQVGPWERVEQEPTDG